MHPIVANKNKVLSAAFLCLFLMQLIVSTGFLDSIFKSGKSVVADLYDETQGEDSDDGKKEKKEGEEKIYTLPLIAKYDPITLFCLIENSFQESFYDSPYPEIPVPPPSIS